MREINTVWGCVFPEKLHPACKTLVILSVLLRERNNATVQVKLFLIVISLLPRNSNCRAESEFSAFQNNSHYFPQRNRCHYSIENFRVTLSLMKERKTSSLFTVISPAQPRNIVGIQYTVTGIQEGFGKHP